MARRDERNPFASRGRPKSADSAVAATGEPIDLLAVRRDNELIEAIASDSPWSAASPEEDALAQLLSAWRADLISAELPDAPDLDAVAAAVEAEIAVAATRRRSSRPRGFVLQATGAAVAAGVVILGVGWFSHSAEPGDPLWGVKQVVFSDQANSTVADQASNDALTKAKALIDAGMPQEAQKQLDVASKRAADVADPTVRRQLVQTWESLTQQAAQRLAATSTAVASAVQVPARTVPAQAPATSVAPAPPLPKVQVSAPNVVQIPSIAPGIPTTIVIPQLPTISLPGH